MAITPLARRARSLPRLFGAVGLGLALVASPACRSLLPQADDSTPVTLALVVADCSIEDETSVSPMDLLSGECDDDGVGPDLEHWAQKAAAGRDLGRRPR